MNIYIGYDHEKKPISVLLAQNREQADIAWAAMRDIPHSVEEIDPTQNNIGVHGLVFLLTSTERNTSEYRHSMEGAKFRDWKRGA